MKRETEMGRGGRWWCLPLVTAISKACKCCWKRFYLNLSRKSWNCVLNKWKNKKHKLTCRGDDNFLCICMKCFTKLLTYSLLSVLIHKLSCRMWPWCTVNTKSILHFSLYASNTRRNLYQNFLPLVPTIVGVLHHKIVLTNTQHLHTSNARKFLWNVCLAFCLRTNDDGITSLATLTMIYTKLYSLYLDRKCSQQSAKPISFTPLLCPQNLLNFSKRQICKQKFFFKFK